MDQSIHTGLKTTSFCSPKGLAILSIYFLYCQGNVIIFYDPNFHSIKMHSEIRFLLHLSDLHRVSRCCQIQFSSFFKHSNKRNLIQISTQFKLQLFKFDRSDHTQKIRHKQIVRNGCIETRSN